jgi:hypothetical protein
VSFGAQQIDEIAAGRTRVVAGRGIVNERYLDGDFSPVRRKPLG